MTSLKKTYTNRLDTVGYSRKPHRLSFALLSVLIGLTGCASFIEYEPAVSKLPFERVDMDVKNTHWWKVFNRSDLNQHVEFALENNFNVDAAVERLKAARAIAKSEKSNVSPKINIEGSVERNVGSGTQATQYSIGPVVTYEVDLWGRQRSRIKAEQARLAVSEEAYRSAVLSLTANVSLTWTRLIEAYNQQALLQQQVINGQQTLEVLSVRYQTGQVRMEDILRQQLANKALQEEQITIETDIYRLNYQLEVLRGENPSPSSQKFQVTVNSALPTLTSLPQQVSVSALLQHRPDVREAYYAMAGADHDFAAAVSAQYPGLTLPASYSSQVSTPSDLFSNWITNLAGNFVAPIFDRGQRSAEALRAKANRDELIARYSQSVLQAFEEVEIALIQEKKQWQRIENLEQRLTLAKTVYEQIQHGYFNGANEFLSVLSAQNEFNSLERDLLRAQRDLIEYRIALHRAVAGDLTVQGKSNFKVKSL